MAMCIRLTYVRLSIHSTVIAMMAGFLETLNRVLIILFLHRLNGMTFYVWQYVLYYTAVAVSGKVERSLTG